MVLESELPESLFDLFKGGSLFEPQDFVVVSKRHNINHLWCHLQLVLRHPFRGLTPMESLSLQMIMILLYHLEYNWRIHRQPCRPVQQKGEGRGSYFDSIWKGRYGGRGDKKEYLGFYVC